jgi:hypothetical protein
VAHACCRIQVPSGSINPSSSAIGTNVAGEIGSPLRDHRTSDSKPTHLPVESRTIGW